MPESPAPARVRVEARIPKLCNSHAHRFRKSLSYPLSFFLSGATPWCRTLLLRPVKENGRLALLFRQRVERPSEGTEPCATNPSPQRVGVACQGGRCRSSACQYCIGGAGSLANGISLRGMNPMAWNAGGRWLSCTVPLRESRSTSARRCCPMWPDACGFEPRRGDHFGGDDGGDVGESERWRMLASRDRRRGSERPAP